MWLFPRKVSWAAKAFYGRIARYSTISGQCWASQETLADEMQCTDRTVRAYVAELTEAGLIRAVQRGRGHTNVYEILRHPWMDEAVDRKVSSGLDRKVSSGPIPTSTREVSEVLPADSASPQDSRAERVRARIDARRNGEPRPRLRSVPDGDDGGSEDEGRILGKDLDQPVAHRSGSGAGLAAYFGREVIKAFDLKALGPRQVNERALARHLKTWRDEGLAGETITKMIDVYCGAAKVPKNASPLWQDFLADKERLFRKARRSLESTRAPAKRFVDPPIVTGTRWTT